MSKKSNGKKKAGIMGLIWKTARELATPIAFLDQISAKDRETMGDAFNSAPATQKLKILTNIVFGRMTGINPFPSEVQAPQTINFGGIFNKWTALGVGLKVYALIGKNLKVNNTALLPHASKLDQLGTRVLTGGAFGGVFDAPGDGSKPAQQQGTRHIILDVPNKNNSNPQVIFKNTSSPQGSGMLVAARSSF